MTPFQERIHGVIPAILTPLNEDGTIDVAGTRRLVRRVIDGGCHGFVVLGTTGEFAGVDDDQRATMISTCVDEAAGKVPVIVGAGQPNVKRVREQLAQAADLGADGALVNPPFYFQMTMDEVLGYFEGLVRSSRIPLMLYNIPSMTKIAVTAPTLRKLADVGVQGTKDSSGDLNNLMQYLAAVKDVPDFRVVVGGDRYFLHALFSGTCATTGMTPNLSPALNLDIYNAWKSGDWQAAVAAQNRCNEFLQAMMPLYPFHIATGKAVLSGLGVMQRWVTAPKTAVPAGQVDGMVSALKAYLPEYSLVGAGA
ncbi:MAG: dihydrodipicolinate synthase family protein [Chloroflexota bacterium]